MTRLAALAFALLVLAPTPAEHAPGPTPPAVHVERVGGGSAIWAGWPYVYVPRGVVR